ncbi:MAG: helix-turn-helix transcriptional regulator [Oscillospiraceae bacterium]
MYDIKANAQKLLQCRGAKRREEVANAINISVSALAMYEQGGRNPRDEVKVALAQYYGKSVEELFFASQVHFESTAGGF